MHHDPTSTPAAQRIAWLLLAAAGLVAGAAPTLAAPAEGTSAAPHAGWLLGAGLATTRLGATGIDAGRGRGVDLTAGWRADPNWALLVSSTGATGLGRRGFDVRVGHLDAMLRYSLVTGSRWQPQISAGATRRTAQVSAAPGVTGDGVGVMGSGSVRAAEWRPSIGLGLAYAVSPAWAWVSTYKYTLGSDVQGTGWQRGAQAHRLGLGLEWRPGAR